MNKHCDKNNNIPKILYDAFIHMDEATILDLCSTEIKQIRKNYNEFNDLIHATRHHLDMYYVYNVKFTIDSVPKHLKCAELLNSYFPELKLFETVTYDCLTHAKRTIDKLSELIDLIKKVENREFWYNLEKMPGILEFEYKYPNGANGDALKYVLDEYGETIIKNSTTWTGRISKKYVDFLEIFAASAPYMSWDARFLCIYDYHLPSYLHRRKNEIVGDGPGSRYIIDELQSILKQQKANQKEARTKLYAQLMLEGKASPRWKSEAQLFSVASALYPDAIYQYRAPWLGFQSLDIFIPSISVAIEYQGIQHYQPIDYFGGEAHYLHQQENDNRKRRLCKENNVRLIEWSWEERISEDLMKKKITVLD